MALPSELECRIVQDLLVGYAAGEIQPDTRDWVDLHLNRCETCRAALAQYSTAAAALAPAEPPPAPSAEPGRRFVDRVRRSVWMLGAALLLCIVITAGAIYFGILAVRRFAGLPADMPVPSWNRTAASVLRDLPMPRLSGGCCTEVERYDELADAAIVVYEDNWGHRIDLKFDRYDSTSAAATGFESWTRAFPARTESVTTETPGFDIAKFKSGHNYFFGWRRGNWVITYAIPDSINNPTRLRDELRDFLYTALK